MTWSIAQERLLRDLSERAQSRSVCHGIEHRKFWRTHAWITVPSIVLTMLAGAASTSTKALVDMLGPSSEPVIPMTIGVVSMLVSILNSVSTFLKIAALTEQNLQSHIAFQKLARAITHQIIIPPQDRSMTGKEACKTFEGQFATLLDTAPLVSKTTEIRFARRRDVKEVGVAVPPLVRITSYETYLEKHPPPKREPKQELTELANLGRVSSALK